MASLSCSKSGLKTIQFTAKDGKRRSIRLGKVSKKSAESDRTMVEHLVSASLTGYAIDNKAAQWLADRDDVMLNKLARVGLAQPRESALLKSFIDGYIAIRTDVKPGTRIMYGQTRRCLLGHFGADKPLRDITRGDAKEWRLYLLKQGLAENTVRRRCGIARQFFGAAQDKGIIQNNPFSVLKCSVRSNAEKMYFVSSDEAEKVLEACPDNEWRLLFALSRYGGFRCPSEHLALRWGDIDWEGNRITVHSSKTEHLEGGGVRQVPLFPELLPHLQEAFDQAEEGAEYVIVRNRRTNANLRTQMHRIIKRAGLKPWPKTFQNLRSSRQTELAETYPIHVVCEWIGNTRAVAAEHYLQVTDEHFKQAAEAVQNPVQHSTAGGCRDMRGVQGEKGEPAVFTALQEETAQCSGVGAGKVGRVGFEPTSKRL